MRQGHVRTGGGGEGEHVRPPQLRLQNEDKNDIQSEGGGGQRIRSQLRMQNEGRADIHIGGQRVRSQLRLQNKSRDDVQTGGRGEGQCFTKRVQGQRTACNGDKVTCQIVVVITNGAGTTYTLEVEREGNVSEHHSKTKGGMTYGL
jgi:hypothetical protein